MTEGKVKWFNKMKGYGFISPNDGGNDVFVHINTLEQCGLSGLQEDDNVQFELAESRGKVVASNIKLIK